MITFLTHKIKYTIYQEGHVKILILQMIFKIPYHNSFNFYDNNHIFPFEGGLVLHLNT